MADKIRVEVELSADQVQQLLAASKAEPKSVRELTDEELGKIMEKIRGGAALEEPEAAIIGKLVSKVVSKISSKQVQRVVADTVVSIVGDTVVSGARSSDEQSPKQ